MFLLQIFFCLNVWFFFVLFMGRGQEGVMEIIEVTWGSKWSDRRELQFKDIRLKFIRVFLVFLKRDVGVVKLFSRVCCFNFRFIGFFLSLRSVFCFMRIVILEIGRVKLGFGMFLELGRIWVFYQIRGRSGSFQNLVGQMLSCYFI